ncbi:MAG TPA: PAS domain S-box protein, partial [Nitrospirota bacterium]
VILYRMASAEIEKRRQAEAELQHLSDRDQTMIKASPLAVTIVDRNGNVELWNPAAEEIFGWTQQEMSGQPLRIVPADRQQEFKAFLDEIFNGKSFKSLETQRLKKDGSLIDVALSTAPLHDARGAVIAAMGIFEDISERKKTEENLRFQASIIQNLPDAVCGIDLNAITVAWNSGAERMLGYKAGEIIGKPITTVIPAEMAANELSHCVTILNADGVLTGYETIRIAKNGRRVPIELTGVAIKDKDQKIINYASIMVDITDRKRAEEERLKRHMLESIGILAAGIAHDFNNLLNVIVGDIHVAKKTLHAGDKAFDRLNDAEQICEIAGELSKRLITFATGGDPLRKAMPVRGLLKDTVTAALKGSAIQAVFDLPENLPNVAMDEGQMKQVIRNLVVNAREAMPNGGILAVNAEQVRVSEQDNLPMRAGNYMKISFRDTGPGIPSENLAKIFDPYYSTKDTFSQKGLGLGLAVCYSIIKRHDGLITVESEIGKGTIFFIYIPLFNPLTGGTA